MQKQIAETRLSAYIQTGKFQGWHMLKRLLPVVVLMSALLCGCQPIYQTFYSYSPPDGVTGMQCVGSCEFNREQCQDNEQTRYQSCEDREEAEYHSCEARREYRYDRDSGKSKCVRNCNCYRDSCPSPDVERCTRTYNNCFENCGGKVKSEVRCVQFCK